MFCQLSDTDVPSTSLDASSWSGMPLVDPIIIGTNPAYAMSPLLLPMARTTSLPLWSVVFLNVIPCCEKNPF
jgi:hypothetical protein